MKHDWKPGDVALVEAGCWANHKVALRLAEGWAHTNGVNVDGDGVVSVVRRLVVIDPEDREASKRLLAEFCEAVDMSDIPAHPQGWSIDAMQAALREFANPTPPKPEEPTGLGAVVEAIYDNHFVRVGPAGWVHVDDRAGNPCDWEDIAVVRVLSEGVQA